MHENQSYTVYAYTAGTVKPQAHQDRGEVLIVRIHMSRHHRVTRLCAKSQTPKNDSAIVRSVREEHSKSIISYQSYPHLKSTRPAKRPPRPQLFPERLTTLHRPIRPLSLQTHRPNHCQLNVLHAFTGAVILVQCNTYKSTSPIFPPPSIIPL
jgi:hypothetical protein